MPPFGQRGRRFGPETTVDCACDGHQHAACVACTEGYCSRARTFSRMRHCTKYWIPPRYTPENDAGMKSDASVRTSPAHAPPTRPRMRKHLTVNYRASHVHLTLPFYNFLRNGIAQTPLQSSAEYSPRNGKFGDEGVCSAKRNGDSRHRIAMYLLSAGCHDKLIEEKKNRFPNPKRLPRAGYHRRCPHRVHQRVLRALDPVIRLRFGLSPLSSLNLVKTCPGGDRKPERQGPPRSSPYNDTTYPPRSALARSRHTLGSDRMRRSRD